MHIASHHGKILLALKALVLALRPDNVAHSEVEVRKSFQIGEMPPFRGVTLHELGEEHDDGTIGTEDTGYRCGVTFVEREDFDAALAGDQLYAWRELIRRHLKNQRLNVVLSGSPEAVKEHVCRVAPPREPNYEKKKFPGLHVQQIVVTVWLREVSPLER